MKNKRSGTWQKEKRNRVEKSRNGQPEEKYENFEQTKRKILIDKPNKIGQVVQDRTICHDIKKVCIQETENG